MDTAQEALFRAMLVDGWFAESDGDVEFSLGYFGWMHNHPSEVSEIRAAFEDTLNAYGPITDEQIVGVWWARINTQGIITITKLGDVDGTYANFAHNPAVGIAKKQFADSVYDYVEWNNENEDDSN